MAENLTTYLSDKLLGHSTGQASYTMPTHTYLGLFTVAPTKSGGGAEVRESGTGYKRVKMSWGSPSEEAISNSAEARFPAVGNATETFGTIVAVGLFDAETSGNLIWFSDLAATVTIESGSFYNIITGGITLTLK